MKTIVENKYVDALLKTLIAVAIVHIVVILIALAIGGTTGLFGIPVLWAHLSSGGVIGATIVVLTLGVLYYIFYKTSG